MVAGVANGVRHTWTRTRRRKAMSSSSATIATGDLLPTGYTGIQRRVTIVCSFNSKLGLNLA